MNNPDNNIFTPEQEAFLKNLEFALSMPEKFKNLTKAKQKIDEFHGQIIIALALEFGQVVNEERFTLPISELNWDTAYNAVHNKTMEEWDYTILRGSQGITVQMRDNAELEGEE